MAPTKSAAAALGQAATQAPQPMQAAASIARSASCFLYGNGVAVGGAAGGNGDEAASGDDAIEGAAVDDEILDDGESFGAPGLEINFVAVFEVAHVKLANGGALESAMGFAVDHHAAHAADAFAAIVIESDGIFTLFDQAFVEDVEHFEEGHVLVDVGEHRNGPCGPCLGNFSGARREE